MRKKNIYWTLSNFSILKKEKKTKNKNPQIKQNTYKLGLDKIQKKKKILNTN